ncbi:MAG: PRC-barrel domain-containing protein [Anaerolineales bacterium]
MLISKGADVITTDGEKLGAVRRVVIDPRTREVTHIVVEKGFLLPTTKVVDINLVDVATEDSVMLREKVEDWSALPDFKETHYVRVSELEEEMEEEVEEEASATTFYWYPPAGTRWWDRAGFVTFPGQGGYTPPPYIAAVEKQNIPSDVVPLQEGAHVFAKDGEHVGNVEAVMTEQEQNRVTHIVISQGLLLTEEKLIPTPWIDLIQEGEVHLAVASDFIENLPPYEPEKPEHSRENVTP